jgi:hypothetical protein
MKTLRVLLPLLFVTTACGSGPRQSPIRVTLTAKNHHPLLTLTGRNHQPPPSQQWGYCVKIRTSSGKPVPAPIQLHLQFVLNRTVVKRMGMVSLNKGYDNWCGSIGGEYNMLEALPPGKKVDFQAVVKSMGVTVRQNWPIVVHVVQ